MQREMVRAFLVTAIVTLVLAAVGLACSPATETPYGPVAPFPMNGAEADQALNTYLSALAQDHAYGMHVWTEYHDKAGTQPAYYGEYEAGYQRNGWRMVYVVEESDLEGSIYLEDVFQCAEPMKIGGGGVGWLLEWHVFTDASVHAWNMNAVTLEEGLQRD